YVYDFIGETSDPDTRTYKVQWSAAPSDSDEFRFITDYRFTYDRPFTDIWCPATIPDPRAGKLTIAGPPARGNASVDQFWCPSRLTKITVNVTTAGTGRLLIRGPSPGLLIFAEIDLSATGERVIEAGSTSGSAGTDVLNDHTSNPTTHADMDEWH